MIIPIITSTALCASITADNVLKEQERNRKNTSKRETEQETNDEKDETE